LQVRKFSLHELELSFTQGRWDYLHWGAAEGIAPIAAKPAGVELWAHLAVESEAEVCLAVAETLLCVELAFVLSLLEVL
jgi:hypothetical protein